MTNSSIKIRLKFPIRDDWFPTLGKLIGGISNKLEVISIGPTLPGTCPKTRNFESGISEISDLLGHAEASRS